MTDSHDRAPVCCPRSSEGQGGLRIILRIGRRGKWLVEPGHQITMGKEVHAQKRHEVSQAPAETRGQLQVAQQQHRYQCRPDLGLDGVRRSTDEGLDLQVLFERLERRSDILPTRLSTPRSSSDTASIRVWVSGSGSHADTWCTTSCALFCIRPMIPVAERGHSLCPRG